MMFSAEIYPSFPLGRHKIVHRHRSPYKYSSVWINDYFFRAGIYARMISINGPFAALSILLSLLHDTIGARYGRSFVVRYVINIVQRTDFKIDGDVNRFNGS